MTPWNQQSQYTAGQFPIGVDPADPSRSCGVSVGFCGGFCHHHCGGFCAGFCHHHCGGFCHHHCGGFCHHHCGGFCHHHCR
ncbi:hypothetical protein [Paenibacillus piri]|nr:hypothetical protein [Paenibacillus piri]